MSPNLSELRTFGLNPQDWLPADFRGSHHVVLCHKNDPDFKILVEVKKTAEIASVKIPLRTIGWAPEEQPKKTEPLKKELPSSKP